MADNNFFLFDEWAGKSGSDKPPTNKPSYQITSEELIKLIETDIQHIQRENPTISKEEIDTIRKGGMKTVRRTIERGVEDEERHPGRYSSSRPVRSPSRTFWLIFLFLVFVFWLIMAYASMPK